MVMSGEAPWSPCHMFAFCLPRARSVERTRGYCDRIVANQTVVDLLLGYLRSKDSSKISVIPSVFVFCSQQHTRRRKTLFAVPINPSHLVITVSVASDTIPDLFQGGLQSPCHRCQTAGARHRRRPFSHRQPPTLFHHFLSITICGARLDHAAD